MVLQPYFTTSG